MTSLNHLVGAVSGEILKMSLEASAMILALLLVCWLLRGHLSARLRYSLWLLVWIKLTLPWLPESVTSVYGLWGERTELSEPLTSTRPDNPLAFTPAHDTPIADLSAEVPSAPAYQTKNVSSDNNPADAYPNQLAPTIEQSSLTLGQMASLGWGVGVLGMGIVMVGNMLSLRRRVMSSSTDLPENMKDMFVQSLKTRGLSKKMSIWVTEAVESPALYGVFRPVILLPKSVMGKYSKEELRLVLLHELEHQMRRDHWVNVWTSVLLALHWFNPIVWYAVKHMRSDREFAVDEAVLRHSNADAETYGESILKTMNRITRQRMQPGLVGILEDKTALKERFERIACFDVHKSESKGAWYVIVLILICAFLSHPMQSDDEMPEDNSGVQVETANENESWNEAVRVLEQRVNAFGGQGPIISTPEKIENQLKTIIIDEVHFVNEPFRNVLEWLYEECQSKTTDSNHVNFVATAYTEEVNGKEFIMDLSHMMKSHVTIDPPMKKASAWDVCHRIIEEMAIPLTMRIEPYAVMFSYEFSEDQTICERRSYKLPEANIIIFKAREILNIPAEEDLSASEALLGIFAAEGISFEVPHAEDDYIDNTLKLMHDASKRASSLKQVANHRSLFYKPNSGLLLISAPRHELEQIDRIVYELTHLPTQVTIELRSGHLTRLVDKESARHTLLRPLGEEVLDRPSARSSTSRQFLLSNEEATAYMNAIKSIQGVEFISPMGVTTINRRPASIGIAMDKEGDQTSKSYSVERVIMKVEVYPSISEQTDMTRDMYIGVQAVLPRLNRDGRSTMFPDESQFPEIHGSSAIPKNHTLLIHYSRRQAQGKPWEESKEEWLQEFVILVTPTLIDPAGNRID